MPLSKNITHSDKYSYYAIAIYAVLKALTVSSITGHVICTSLYQIKFYLGCNEDTSRRLNSSIQRGINELVDNGIISILEENNKNYIFDCTKLYSDSENGDFTIITYYEMRKILSVDNTNNFLLLKYFIYLISTISSSITVSLWVNETKNHVVGNFSLDYISEMSGIGLRTVIEYNKILEDIGLIYICRQNDFTLNDKNEIKQLKNVYGRLCDKEYIDLFAFDCKKYEKSYIYTTKNVNIVNNNRRLAQMYNYLKNYGDNKYSNGELLDIYRYVIRENKKYVALYEKTKYDMYLNKIRDTEIFKKYDFYKD